MAYSYIEYTATGSPQILTVPEYIDQSHISVRVNGVDTPGFTWITSNTIQLTAAAASKVRVMRRSSPDARVTDYIDGVPLTELALDNDSKQAFFLAQEQLDATNDALAIVGYGSLDEILSQVASAASNASAAAASAAAAAASVASAASAGSTAGNAAALAVVAGKAASGDNGDITHLNGNPNSIEVKGASGIIGLINAYRLALRVSGAAAATDISGLDFCSNGSTTPQARIAAAFSGGGSTLYFGTSNNYVAGITHVGMSIGPTGIVAITTPLALSSGGTGGNTAAAATAALGVAGSGQNLVSYTGVKALGVLYYNSTPRPIKVNVTATQSGGASCYLVANISGFGNVLASTQVPASTGFATSISFEVPPGAGYTVSVGSGAATVTVWTQSE